MKDFFKKCTPKMIANAAGIVSLVCYLVTAVSYYLNDEVLLFSFEIVYFIGMCLTLYYLGYYVYAQYKKKAVRENTHLVISALIFFGILLFVYLIAGKHHRIIDITENKRFSLSEQTHAILDALDTDVEIMSFMRTGQKELAGVRKLLEQYAYQSERVTFRMLDPQEYPRLTEQYNVEKFGEIIMRTDERHEKVVTLSEEGITNGLLKVTSAERKRVAFLTGHGEPSLEDGEARGFSLLKRHLDLENYQYEELVLMREADVPAGIDCVVIVSPKTDLFDNELAAIRRFFDAGGSVFVLLDPDAVETVEELVTEWGFILNEGILIDPMAQVFQKSPLIPIITQYVPHPITENFTVAAMLPTARQIDVSQALPEAVAGHALGYTGPGSWVETTPISPEAPPELTRGDDIPGPVSVMSVLEKVAVDEADADMPLGRVVVVGDSNFVDNSSIGLSGNRDLFLNTLAWLVRDETLIAIRSKTTDSVPMFLSGPHQLLFFTVPVVLLPLTLLVIGILVVFRSRRR